MAAKDWCQRSVSVIWTKGSGLYRRPLSFVINEKRLFIMKKLKMVSRYTAALVMAVILTGCSSQPNASTDTTEDTSTAVVHQEQEDITPTETNSAEADSGKILIAYFTWSDNTIVENPEAVDIDASTSASVLPPGNTGLMASYIQQYTGGDIFSIRTVQPYSSNYDECLEQADAELAGQVRPELIESVENMDEYDIIFLGYPNWWSSCPMAVFSFLEEYDFTGKTVIPFVAHGTGGVGRSLIDIREMIPEADIRDEISFSRENIAGSQAQIESWLEELSIR